MSTSQRAQELKPGTPVASKFRSDIQGLRAIAVALVVIYHLWPESVTGGFIGVDVFLVISGFLITSHLLRDPPRSVRDFTAFWARRIRRLLPASFLVLIVTLAATRFVAAETVWVNAGKQVIASALYVQNWVLGFMNVDYLAADNAPTPVQHYWSLSVEEQFYLLWPIVIALLFGLALRRNKSPYLILGWGMATIILASFSYSIYSTSTNPGWAYFATTTRIWELALGGATALYVSRRKHPIPTGIGIATAWVGVLGVFIAAVTFDGSTPFPGFAAALPVLATALVIAAASSHQYSPNTLLCFRPMQFLGDISFSVYLWHWPIIVLMPFVSGSLGWIDKSMALVVTVSLAALTKRFVEDRFRLGGASAGTRPAYKFAAAGMIAIVMAGSLLLFESKIRTQIGQDRANAAFTKGDPCFGAAALEHGLGKCPEPEIGTLIPQPAAAVEDKSEAYQDECWSNQPYVDRPICTYGSGTKRIALVGNSHAGQWLPALQAIAESQDWTIDTYLIDRCNPTTVKLEFDAEVKAENCLDYGRWAMKKTTVPGNYDMVVTSARQSLPVADATWKQTESLATDAYVDYLQLWTDAGIDVVVIKDPPYPGNTVSSIPECIAKNPNDLARCSGSLTDWYWMDPLSDAANRMKSPTVNIVDLDKYFCIERRCLPVIGSVITYFDGSHVTATYARTLAPYLAHELKHIVSKE